MATHVSTMDQITDYLGIPLPGLEFSKMGYVAAYLRDPVNCCKPSVASIGQYFRHLSLKIGDRVKLQMASDLIQDRFYIQIQHGKGNCGRWYVHCEGAEQIIGLAYIMVIMAKKMSVAILILLLITVTTTMADLHPPFIPCCHGGVTDCCPTTIKEGDPTTAVKAPSDHLSSNSQAKANTHILPPAEP
ncbi:uncharacterized protein LOC132275476 isoform X1 [Cornus florida]|uniref:uncharacterized protein LOC132275476 isoform X1 n=1 Tax=Cornus florida TaxID=4283 RepID=UPI002899273A|nr:uncharacterized protein LOC132275476 isoform X1 [Cornus florida]